MRIYSFCLVIVQPMILIIHLVIISFTECKCVIFQQSVYCFFGHLSAEWKRIYIFGTFVITTLGKSVYIWVIYIILSFYLFDAYIFLLIWSCWQIYFLQAGNVEGQVVDMGLTTTSLLNAEKFPVIVPNSLFSSQVGAFSCFPSFFFLCNLSSALSLHHTYAWTDIILKAINRDNLRHCWII